MLKRIPVFARFQWINHPVLRRTLKPFFRYAGTGRRGYDKVTLFLWLMWKQVMRCSYRDLESVSGIDHSTFIKFRSRLKKRLPLLFEELTAFVLKRLHKLDLILDSSFVETYSKKNENGSGYSGHKEKNGFKTHEIIDFEHRIPLFQMITAGNVADVTAAYTLIDRAPPDIPVASFSADKGYDSEYLVQLLASKWHIAPAIPMRRFAHAGNAKNRKVRGSDRSSDPSIYRRRTEIERHFSRKKQVFNLGEERTRHFENFQANAYFVSCMEILEWLTKEEQRAA